MAAAADFRRPTPKFVAALSRTSSAFLFFSVVVVGLVSSARWITSCRRAPQPRRPFPPPSPPLPAPEYQRRRRIPPTPSPAPRRRAPRLTSPVVAAPERPKPPKPSRSRSPPPRPPVAPPLNPATASASVSASNSSSCPSYFRFIHEDLRPWRDAGGITRAMLARARVTASFRLLVLGGRAFVHRFARHSRPAISSPSGASSSCSAATPGGSPTSTSCSTAPTGPSSARTSTAGSTLPFMPPLFSYCGDDRTLDIVFPDWSFWGWPEINIKPWDALRQDLKDGNNRVKWLDRVPYAYWKGNPAVAVTRQELVNCNVSTTKDWNARIYKQDWFRESKAGYKDSNLGSQCTHRYKIYIEGSAWSVSQKYILACDSMTLLVTPRYYDFFSRSLMPIQHYWPVHNDNKCDSIKYAVDWGNSHKQLAQRIGKQASDFIEEDVNMDRVYDYMLHLLTEYAKLLRFRPIKPPEAVEICPDSLACQAEGLEKKFLMESMVKSARDAGPCDLPPPFNPQELAMIKRRKDNSIKQIQTWERISGRA
ncbi:hypothetical protein OsJ_15589 [Oryza sativa Japonica Group]|uniref:Glycosyl transferase CAP10 domain-containing protein n=1 Tax=Oryza sativa subsp. japonica TaxID=39947 RepID=B9FGB9_ORYSJ|nr:hypothetical protein OsJ_15589 [Oryza sativa Japonica Group]